MGARGAERYAMSSKRTFAGPKTGADARWVYPAARAFGGMLCAVPTGLLLGVGTVAILCSPDHRDAWRVLQALPVAVAVGLVAVALGAFAMSFIRYAVALGLSLAGLMSAVSLLRAEDLTAGSIATCAAVFSLGTVLALPYGLARALVHGRAHEALARRQHRQRKARSDAGSHP